MIKRKAGTSKKAQETMLPSGIVLEEKFVKEESRLLTLAIKGILVYLIVMGTMGALLSAVDADYHVLVVHSVLLFAGIFCAFLYYSKLWENIGYVLLLIIMFATGIGLRKYINSGFYAVANDLAEKASIFFDSNAMRSFGEQIGNRELAITISMCYIGSVCCIFMNILISRRMQYILALPLSIGCLIFPLYLEAEPSLEYVSMLCTGILSAYMIRGNGHYQLTRNNSCYQFDKKRNQIRYVYHWKILTGIVLAVFVICFLILQLLGVVYSQERFRKQHSTSPIKEKSLDTVENIYLLGVMGVFNFYPNTGGLTNGTLGGVSAIRLDYNTDLTVEFTPYTYDRVYLKTFTGAKYLPYSNQWSRLTADEKKLDKGIDTVKLLKKDYKNKEYQSAKGKMKITNVAAAVGGYLPYYSRDDEEKIYPGETKEYTYYPYLASKVFQEGWNEEMEIWLEVPEQNQEVIQRFCEEAEISGTEEEIIQKVIQYYQEEIPYTYRPGATPWRQDFVNYFLEKNKKGYCAHFASAATLIFRNLGIPARYVEGYAIDTDEISEEGKVLTDKKYEDYYDGYSEIGKTGVVSQNVTDADAHAWVEVYVDGRGWTPVEVTPSSGEEEPENDFWNMFLRLLGNGEDSVETETGETEENVVFDERTREVSRNVAFIVSVIIIVVIVGQWLIKTGIDWWKYERADRNEKLILQYRKYLQKQYKKQLPEENLPNYRQQIQWLCERGCLALSGNEREQCVRILEQAGFSSKEISEEQLTLVLSWIRSRKDSAKS